MQNLTNYYLAQDVLSNISWKSITNLHKPTKQTDKRIEAWTRLIGRGKNSNSVECRYVKQLQIDK